MSFEKRLAQVENGFMSLRVEKKLDKKGKHFTELQGADCNLPASERRFLW